MSGRAVLALVPHRNSLPQCVAKRTEIYRLENSMRSGIKASKLAERVSPLKHHFAPGVYGREIFLEAGTCVVGKIHKQSHLNIISKGHVVVVTEFGKEEHKVTDGPITWVSPVGIKRAVFAIEDTYWTCIHPTDASTPEAVEEEVIAKRFSEIPEHLIGTYPPFLLEHK